jgi:hypothetical protein
VFDLVDVTAPTVTGAFCHIIQSHDSGWKQGFVLGIVLEMKVAQSVLKRPERATPAFLEGKIGWGGRIRTFTIHINSVVSYRLDHAPAALRPTCGPNKLGRLRRKGRGGGFF